jgi:hypothetical protein
MLVLDALFDHFQQTSSNVEIIGSLVQCSPISAIDVRVGSLHAAHDRRTLRISAPLSARVQRCGSLIDSLYATLEVMQRNFWKTIKADGNDRCSDTDRGIAHHIAMFPWSRAHMPWQNRIKSDCDGLGRTDLTSMGVAAQKQIEISMCCLAVDFRRMRQQD